MRIVLAAWCLFVLGGAVSMTAGEARGESGPSFDRAMVIEPTRRAGRSPVRTDPVEHAFITGGLDRRPMEGDGFDVGGRRVEWMRARFDDGRLEHAALRGGYAHASIESARERVMLLRVRGHASVVVNGEPRTGDPYSTGTVTVPVLLRAGTNVFLFRGIRGWIEAALEEPTDDVYLVPTDPTLPDLIAGESGRHWAGVMVVNATAGWAEGLGVVATTGSGRSERVTQTTIGDLPPLSVRKLAVPFEVAAVEPGAAADVRFELLAGAMQVSARRFELRVREPHDVHRRTFVSGIDGSVQTYAVRPRSRDADDESPAAMVLSLHGAGVEAQRQASAYGARDWAHVVAPTNRRAFGFDWEDWGRLDAMEVLEHAAASLGTDPRRTYLTGHSMGGHGTWHLGVTYPCRFAAIGPSAGWVSFWSYGGAPAWENPTPVEAVLRRAMTPSDTLALSENLRHSGVYVLHGDRDETVPVSEARTMRERLGGFHTDFAYYERPGAGHWWGDECMDWPPMFEFFRQRSAPDPERLNRVSFATAHPGVSASCHWVTVEQAMRAMEVSRVDVRLRREEGRIEISTHNVSRVRIDLAGAGMEGGPGVAVVDGDEVGFETADGVVVLARDVEGWRAAGALDPSEKGPHRAGPFKDAFRNRMVFVVGTGGTEAENAWALQKARYDAETFWYRGNGSVDIVRDVEFVAEAEPDRNVILYGGAGANRAWDGVIDEGSPVRVERGRVRVGERVFEGDDLGVLLVRPRRGSDVASVGIVAGTGEAGRRVLDQMPVFVSGAAFPDWMVVRAAMLLEGSDGIVGAGFFDNAWGLDERQSALNEDRAGGAE